MVRGEQQGGRAAPHSHEERGGRASFVDTLTDDPRRAALHVLRDSDWPRAVRAYPAMNFLDKSGPPTDGRKARGLEGVTLRRYMLGACAVRPRTSPSANFMTAAEGAMAGAKAGRSLEGEHRQAERSTPCDAVHAGVCSDGRPSSVCAE